MLEIKIRTDEKFDEAQDKFVWTTHSVRLEHSLVSVSKWESFWKIPFLGKEDKTSEQTISYVKMMILDEETPLEVFDSLIKNHQERIVEYIEDSMTATVISELNPKKGRPETVTSELIYYWMISMQVPVEFEIWHLNRLITLIRVIGVKNAPKEKMNPKDRREMNRARMARHKTRG